MATLYNVPEKPIHKHYKSYFSTLADQLAALEESSTVYVGNLSVNTPEERIYDFFSRCGTVKDVIMGVNRFDLKPCGFCFVIFESHEVAKNAVYFFSGLKIDGQPIRIEMDWGFSDGRQYGRAADGGQMRHFLNGLKSTNNGRDRKNGGNYHYEGRRNTNNYRGGKRDRYGYQQHNDSHHREKRGYDRNYDNNYKRGRYE